MILGKKITLKIINQRAEKDIKVREGLTINNLKAIVEGVLQYKMEKIEVIQEGKEVTGHRKLKELGLEEGHKIEIKGS